MSHKQETAEEFLARKAKEDPARYEAAREHTPINDEGSVSVSTGSLTNVFGSAYAPPPTPTRPIPEEQWAKSQEAQAWYLNIHKHLTYKQIAADMEIALGTVKSHISRANKSLERFRTAPGWIGWTTLVDFVREAHDPPEWTEEDSLYLDEQQMTYAQLAQRYADNSSQAEPEFFPDEPEEDVLEFFGDGDVGDD
jgi:hypothetical protein